MRRQKPGFSLLEILIVVACIAVAALLVMPMAASTDGSKLRAAGRLLLADLELAQHRSMASSLDPCAIVFEPAQQRYYIARTSNLAAPITITDTGLSTLTTFGQDRAAALEGVTIDHLSVGGDNRLVFTALGALDQGSDATITLRKGSATLRITLDANTGLARVD